MFREVFLMIFLYFIAFAATSETNENVDTKNSCQEVGDCTIECKEPCGCDRFVYKAYVYNETTNECQLDLKFLMLLMVEKYDNQAKINVEAERVFNGIMVTAILFVSCTGICAILACIYCIRMNYTDYLLKKDVKELAKKLGGDKLKKPDKKKLKPVEESCNVIVEDAGLFVL